MYQGQIQKARRNKIIMYSKAVHYLRITLEYLRSPILLRVVLVLVFSVVHFSFQVPVSFLPVAVWLYFCHANRVSIETFYIWSSMRVQKYIYIKTIYDLLT